MQQRPGKRASNPPLQRTQPALPGVTLPTAPAVARAPRYTIPLQATKRYTGWRTIVQLLALGIVLALVYLALYPLLAGPPRTDDPVQRALTGVFPWITHFYWTNVFPALPRLLNRVPWLSLTATPRTGIGLGSANVALLLLLLASAVTLVAAYAGRRATRVRLSLTMLRIILLVILILTAIIALVLLGAPIIKGAVSQDMLLYGLYGRMVAVYHVVNPYVVAPTSYPHDMLQTLVKARGAAPYGPAWVDLSALVALLAGNSIANVVLGFRLVGLVAHLVNVMLVWMIFTRLKPEARVGATLLYAWNPVVLLLGIYQMHQEIVIVLFILLAVLCFQRGAPTLGWVFVLLLGMINALYLLLLPLFFYMMVKESRVLRLGRRFLWWLGMIMITALVLVLAYLPYWREWGIVGIGMNIRSVFWQDSAVNSLDAALGNLGLTPQPVILWLTNPHHWSFLALLIAASVLLLGIWLADTLELVLLFSSWLLLILVMLNPINWPWYVIPLLVVSIVSANRQTILLTVLLTGGALLSYYFWLWPIAWAGQALVTVGLPVLIWGWALFFTSTWRMAHAHDEDSPGNGRKEGMRLSRPSLRTRPSWPSRLDRDR